MRTLQFTCHTTTIVTGTVAITALVLLSWPLLAGINAAVCGAAVIGGELVRRVADERWDEACR